jgi:hypothetical protein
MRPMIAVSSGISAPTSTPSAIDSARTVGS